MLRITIHGLHIRLKNVVKNELKTAPLCSGLCVFKADFEPKCHFMLWFAQKDEPPSIPSVYFANRISLNNTHTNGGGTHPERPECSEYLNLLKRRNLHSEEGSFGGLKPNLSLLGRMWPEWYLRSLQRTSRRHSATQAPIEKGGRGIAWYNNHNNIDNHVILLLYW